MRIYNSCFPHLYVPNVHTHVRQANYQSYGHGGPAGACGSVSLTSPACNVHRHVNTMQYERGIEGVDRAAHILTSKNGTLTPLEIRLIRVIRLSVCPSLPSPYLFPALFSSFPLFISLPPCLSLPLALYLSLSLSVSRSLSLGGVFGGFPVCCNIYKTCSSN